MDRLIIIEQPVITVDPVSSQRKITSWTTFTKVWANRMQDSKEVFEVQKQVSKNTGNWQIRNAKGVDETMRINDKGTYHYILGIKRNDRNNTLDLATEERDG